MASPSLAQALERASDYLEYVMRTTAQSVSKPTLSADDEARRAAALAAFRAAKTLYVLSGNEAERNVGATGRRIAGWPTIVFNPSDQVTGWAGMVGV